MATKKELKERLVTGHEVTQKDLHDLIDVAGKQGPPGSPGEDGFGTEAQYNDIISRLKALEGGE